MPQKIVKILIHFELEFLGYQARKFSFQLSISNCEIEFVAQICEIFRQKKTSTNPVISKPFILLNVFYKTSCEWKI